MLPEVVLLSQAALASDFVALTVVVEVWVGNWPEESVVVHSQVYSRLQDPNTRTASNAIAAILFIMFNLKSEQRNFS